MKPRRGSGAMQAVCMVDYGAASRKYLEGYSGFAVEVQAGGKIRDPDLPIRRRVAEAT